MMFTTTTTAAPRALLAAVVAVLALAAPAAAQDDLGSYTTPTDVVTTPTTPTTTPTEAPPAATGDTPTPTPTPTPASETSGEVESGATGDSAVKPSRASGIVAGESTTGSTAVAAATGTTPQQLAFTGAEPVIVGGLGLLLMGAALVLQRRRRSRTGL